MRKYSWGNARALSYSLGWLRAGFTVTSCNLPAETVTFAYTPEKVSALLSGQYSRGQGKSASAAKLPSNILAMPSASEVEKYLCAWDNVETYRLQESALNKLFFELAPRNDNKEIDQYLWQLGKANFPKKYYRRVNDKRKGRHIDYA